MRSKKLPSDPDRESEGKDGRPKLIQKLRRPKKGASGKINTPPEFAPQNSHVEKAANSDHDPSSSISRFLAWKAFSAYTVF